MCILDKPRMACQESGSDCMTQMQLLRAGTARSVCHVERGQPLLEDTSGRRSIVESRRVSYCALFEQMLLCGEGQDSGSGVKSGPEEREEQAGDQGC